MKEEAADYLQADTIRSLVKKYSQFINFPIYLWASHTETVEEPDDEPTPSDDTDEDAQVGASSGRSRTIGLVNGLKLRFYLSLFTQVEDAEEKPEKKKTEKTVWDWELMNDNKPIWTRKPNEVNEDEYTQFYKSLTKDSSAPLSK